MTGRLAILRARRAAGSSWRMFTIIMSALLAIGCLDSDENRRSLVEISCNGDECHARWSASQLWSRVHPAEELDQMEPINPEGLWACEPDPDVDLCVVVDTHGHMGCFRVEGDWAVAVYPSCAGPGLSVGCGMSASASILAR